MPSDPFSPEQLGKPVDDDALTALRTAGRRPRLPRPRKGEPYLGGPIPMGWIEQATALPGKAWHLGCALWFEAKCSRKQSPTVQVPPRTLRRFGLDNRTTFYRALEALERAGLVGVEHRRGRPTRITILEAPSTPTIQGSDSE